MKKRKKIRNWNLAPARRGLHRTIGSLLEMFSTKWWNSKRRGILRLHLTDWRFILLLTESAFLQFLVTIFEVPYILITIILIIIVWQFVRSSHFSIFHVWQLFWHFHLFLVEDFMFRNFPKRLNSKIRRTFLQNSSNCWVFQRFCHVPIWSISKICTSKQFEFLLFHFLSRCRNEFSCFGWIFSKLASVFTRLIFGWEPFWSECGCFFVRIRFANFRVLNLANGGLKSSGLYSIGIKIPMRNYFAPEFISFRTTGSIHLRIALFRMLGTHAFWPKIFAEIHAYFQRICNTVAGSMCYAWAQL